MYDLTMKEVLSEGNVQEAIAYLRQKRNAAGEDGVWLHDLEEYWKINKAALKRQLLDETYEPQIVHEKTLLTPEGKHREISLFSSVDRLLLRSLYQKLAALFEKGNSQYSFAFQKGKSMEDAVSCAAEYIESGKKYVVKIDIKEFFDHIALHRLMGNLKDLVRDHALYVFLEKNIFCKIEKDFQLSVKECGLVQGSPISPVLSNFYLFELDRWMEQQKFSFCRFADDINIYVTGIEEGYRILNKTAEQLKKLELEINREKSGVYSAFAKKYLGYTFEQVGEAVVVKKRRGNKNQVYFNWHQSAIEKLDQEYHIVNDGILTKKDFTILFENEEKKSYIPVETMNAINIYSNIIFSSNFFELLAKKQLNLNIYNKYGMYIGSFFSGKQKNRMKCLEKQVMIYAIPEKRLEYAKKLDMASVHNLRCNLKYYLKKRESVPLQQAIAKISDNIKQMNEAKNVDEVLLCEGRCRQLYYQCLNEIIKEKNFSFSQRTKRPPKDEINAMISFGNVYLYQKIAQMIYKSNLDIRISFVHSAMKRFENLNLDLADIFKPVIIDRVIFSMINKKMISAREHFEKQEKGVLLNNAGKSIFIQELNRKMQQIITVDQERLTYERLLQREVRNLENSILNETGYKPFKYQL